MRVRDLVPYRELVLETSWSPEVAMSELGKQVDPPQVTLHAIGDAKLPFHGLAVSATAMTFQRKDDAGYYRPPVIRASVEPATEGGARVRIVIGSRLSAIARLAVVTIYVVGSMGVAIAMVREGGWVAALGCVVSALGFGGILLVPIARRGASSEGVIRGIYEGALRGAVKETI